MTVAKKTLWQAVAVEPVELAISQPHQALISTASVYLVAAEAGTLIMWPWNLALAIGAEWAYLKGLSSGQGTTSKWAARLNWAAVLLVVLYGSLWGFRKFGLLPPGDQPMIVTDVAGGVLAVVLTLIHILSIGAVTLCSAMVHRESQLGQSARELRLQAERDALALEMERERERLRLWEEGQQAKARLRDAGQMPKKIGTVPTVTGKTARCAVCQQDVAYETPSQAGTIRRWGCDPCRAAKKAGAS